MKNYFFLVLGISFLLISCAREKDIIPQDVEKDYQFFVTKGQEFNADIKNRAIQIRFEKTPKNEVAQCERSNDLALIRISPTIWKNAAAEGKQMILFHELGHCLLDREHTNQMIGGRPKSLMHHYGVSARQYKEHQDDYLRELFTSR